VDSDCYFFTLTRYIELNPVRANMVTHPADYRWSSFHANALGQADKVITFHPLYLNLGVESLARQACYKSMFDIQLSQEVLEDLREATNKGWAFGRGEFKKRLVAAANRPVVSAGWGGDRRLNGL
jgi:putative transposase